MLEAIQAIQAQNVTIKAQNVTIKAQNESMAK